MLLKDYESVKLENGLQLEFCKDITNAYDILLYDIKYPEQRKIFRNVPNNEAYYIYKYVIDKELSKLSEYEIDNLFSIYDWTDERERNLLKIVRELKNCI